MPTYVVYVAADRLSRQAKREIAKGVTSAHSNATGAQGFFAQVIFNKIASDDHFLGGSPLKSDLIYVHGSIRAGRNAEQKRQLLESIVDVVVKAANTEKRFVWAYLSELPPAQMVEYGKVLPEPGTESNWLESMSAGDREYLLSIG